MFNCSNRYALGLLVIVCGCGHGGEQVADAAVAAPDASLIGDASGVCGCPAPRPGRVTYCGRFVSIGKESGALDELRLDELELFGGSYFLTNPATAPRATPEALRRDQCGNVVIENLFPDPLGVHALVARDGEAGIVPTVTLLSHVEYTSDLLFFAMLEEDVVSLETGSGLGWSTTGLGLALFRDCSGRSQTGVTVTGDGDIWYFSDNTAATVQAVDLSATATGRNGAALLGPQSLEPTVVAAPATCERAILPRALPGFVIVREMWPVDAVTEQVPCAGCP